jgi:hypothetical protein
VDAYWGDDGVEWLPLKISDLLCDLMHLLDQYNIAGAQRLTLDQLLDIARLMHEDQLAYEGARCDSCGNAVALGRCTINPNHLVAKEAP